MITLEHVSKTYAAGGPALNQFLILLQIKMVNLYLL